MEEDRCFAIGVKNECRALKYKKCCGYDQCKFYKTEEQLKKERISSSKKISELDKDLKEHILKKYQ
jgi:hypothetical protein